MYLSVVQLRYDLFISYENYFKKGHISFIDKIEDNVNHF